MSAVAETGFSREDNGPSTKAPPNGLRPSTSPPDQAQSTSDIAPSAPLQYQRGLETQDDASRFFDFDEWLSLEASASTSGWSGVDHTLSRRPEDLSSQGASTQSGTSGSRSAPDWDKDPPWEAFTSSSSLHHFGVDQAEHPVPNGGDGALYPISDLHTNSFHHQPVDPSTYPLFNPDPPNQNLSSPGVQKITTLSPPFATDLLAFLTSTIRPPDQTERPPLNPTPMDPPVPSCQRCSTTHSTRFTDIGEGVVVCNACRLFVMSHRRVPNS